LPVRLPLQVRAASGGFPDVDTHRENLVRIVRIHRHVVSEPALPAGIILPRHQGPGVATVVGAAKSGPLAAQAAVAEAGQNGVGLRIADGEQRLAPQVGRDLGGDELGPVYSAVGGAIQSLAGAVQVAAGDDDRVGVVRVDDQIGHHDGGVDQIPVLTVVDGSVGSLGSAGPQHAHFAGAHFDHLYAPFLVGGPVQAFGPGDAAVGGLEDSDAVAAAGQSVGEAALGVLVGVHLAGADEDGVGILLRDGDGADRQYRMAGGHVLPGQRAAAAGITPPQAATGRSGVDCAGVQGIEGHRQGPAADVVRAERLPGSDRLVLLLNVGEVAPSLGECLGETAAREGLARVRPLAGPELQRLHGAREFALFSGPVRFRCPRLRSRRQPAQTEKPGQTQAGHESIEH